MTNKQTSGKERFLKFALVGASGTVVDFAIFNLFSSLIGLATIPSSVISFIVALFNNFFWNRHWTYPESKQFSLSDQLGKFAMVSVAGLIIRTFIFSAIENQIIQFSEQILPNSPVTPEIIGHNLTLAAVIIVVLFWNYFANKFWTYKGIKEHE